ncbi:MAG TPA: MFS transporter [Rectinemataceae bacterium]|nr:MFS transporter [Rectinemataceae bacterium]
MTTKSSPTITRPLVIIGIAESISGIGNWITMMAVLVIIVFHGGGSTAASAGILLAGLLPVLVISPLAGWLCDRFDLKRLMIVSECASAITILTMTFVTSTSGIYALLALSAMTGSIMTPARGAALPKLVSDAKLIHANAFLQQLGGIIKMGAPVLAGALLAFMSPRVAMLLDVASFLLSAALLSTLPRLRQSASARPAIANAPVSEPKSHRERVAGIIFSSRELQTLFASVFVVILVAMGFDVLAPVFFRDKLGAGEETFGLLVGMVGIGTVAGSTMLMSRSRFVTWWRDIITGILMLSAIPLAMVSVTFVSHHAISLVAAAAGCLLGGFGSGLINVQAATLLQLLSPAAYLGRVVGAYQGILTSAQLVGAIATPLIVPAVISARSYFGMAAAALFVLSVAVWLATRRTGTGLEEDMAHDEARS